MAKRPKFIIIGAMKAATSTLQEQLAAQPGIFMTRPKEPNFFSDDAQFAKGIDWYEGLFSGARDGDLMGEASTHYTKLPTYPNTVARMKCHLPDVRLVYVMRHPIDRLISHYIHEWSTGKIRCGIAEAVERYPELVRYGQYAWQLAPYLEAYGREAVLPVFFERLVHAPQQELIRICRFIGYQGTPVWKMDVKPSNRSSERIRKFPLYELVVESKLATALRRSLVPRRVRDGIKGRLAMRERPTLAGQQRRKLERVFDAELEQLGEWLQVDLNCGNFKSVTGREVLERVRAHG